MLDFFTTAYVADWKVQLDAGKPHEVKDHSVEVRLPLLFTFLNVRMKSILTVLVFATLCCRIGHVIEFLETI